MDLLKFAQQKALISKRVMDLQARLLEGEDFSRDEDAISLALEDLQVALEELQVAEEELHQQNEALLAANVTIETERLRYQELFEFAPESYVVTDTYGVIREANQATTTLLGVEAKRLPGKPLVAFMDLERRKVFRSKLMYLLQNGTEQSWEMILCSRQGTPFHAALKATVVCYGQTEASAIRWIIRDITPQKEAEAQLHSLNTQLMQRRSLDQTLHAIGNCLRNSLDETQIIQTTMRELVLALNLSACDVGIYDLAHQTSTVYPSFSQTEVLPSEPGTIAMQQFAEGYRQLLQKQEFQFCERTNHPVRSHMSILACPIVDYQEVVGDIWCFIPCDRTLTSNEVYLVQQVASQCAIALRQARLYQDAQNQVEQLKQLNALKQDFLSTISHELRTPLTNIKMSLYVMQIAKSEEQRERCYRIIGEECDREIGLITDLLDLQYLEAGSYAELFLDSIHVHSWLPKILEPLKGAFASQQQPFKISVARRIPHLVTDRKSLERVLQELLKNAQKHTPFGGEILLDVQYKQDSDRLLFTLQNQAEIAPEALPFIFEKFYRLPAFNSAFINGTGLGLPLTKRLVEYLQGTITVTSSQGWTTIVLNLPMRLSSRPT